VGQTGAARIRMLVEHARRQEQIGRLLDAVRSVNPKVLQEFEPRLFAAPVAESKPPKERPLIDVGRLPPDTGPHFIGREKELGILDTALADSRVHVLTLVGSAGIGKSALISR